LHVCSGRGVQQASSSVWGQEQRGRRAGDVRAGIERSRSPDRSGQRGWVAWRAASDAVTSVCGGLVWERGCCNWVGRAAAAQVAQGAVWWWAARRWKKVGR
jgi:hypothetical protein